METTLIAAESIARIQDPLVSSNLLFVGYPPPIGSNRPTRPAIGRQDPPLGPGTLMEPRQIEAEVLYMDGQWRSTAVLAWLRLNVAYRQPLTSVWIFWLVQLRLPDESEGWFEYDKRNLRPRAQPRR